jgi:RNA polymerase sigma-70 factor (ECF subfamily)
MTNTAEVITVEANRKLSDEDIVQRVVDGDTDQFRLLYERYATRVWRFAVRMTGNVEAEDLTSEIFVEVFKNLSKFRGEASFSTWIYRVMVTRALNFQIRQRNQSFRGKQEPMLHVITSASAENPEETALNKEFQSHLQRAISELQPKARAAVVLSAEGFSYDEIADLLQCSKGNVGSILTRARAELAHKLKRLKGSNRK